MSVQPNDVLHVKLKWVAEVLNMLIVLDCYC